MSGLTITPFPVGEIFEMGVKKQALLVPSQDAIEAAGAPAGMNPVGQQVPPLWMYGYGGESSRWQYHGPHVFEQG